MYILIQDEKIKINGQVFEAIDETPTHYVINQDGIKTWISRDNVRLMPEDYKPGIPEAFDAEDSMFVPKIDGWVLDPRTIAMSNDNDELRIKLKTYKKRLERANRVIDALTK